MNSYLLHKVANSYLCEFYKKSMIIWKTQTEIPPLTPFPKPNITRI